MIGIDLGEYRHLGKRKDGWDVVVTAEIIGDTNVFEVKRCGECGKTKVRIHDAEAYRLERQRHPL